jgi:fatty-acyl-CoA synthase
MAFKKVSTLVDVLEGAVGEFGPRKLFGTKRDGQYQWITYQEFGRLVGDFRGGLAALGIKAGDRVAIIANNRVEWAVAAYATYSLGGCFVPMYEQQHADDWKFIINDSGAKLLIVATRKIAEQTRPMIGNVGALERVVCLEGEASTEDTYAHTLKLGQATPAAAIHPADTELAGFIYTSGTTGNPKGAVYHHRGAYLNAVSNILVWAMPQHPVYLWTLPMFHCNGWCFPWTVAAMAGTHVCLRKVDAALTFVNIRQHQVTHYCGAPIVHALLVNAPQLLRAGITHRVHAMVAGAAPPSAMIEGMDQMGFELTHVYGLTEVYGPATVCARQDDWAALDAAERAQKNARQGVRYPMEEAVKVLDPQTMQEVPHDGESMGEVMFRGNITMRGYLKNDKATAEAFAGGWFHSGDLAVVHPDGYLKIKDRSKDIIISGGENISSIEVEDVLYRHPAVLAAAVVAQPDARWGEVPCAFVELKDGAQVTAEALTAHCRAHLAGFKTPKHFVFGALPKTSTGKIQKFLLRQQARSAAAIDT